MPVQVQAFETILPAGGLLLETVQAALMGRGFKSGVLELNGGGFDPFTYVMPALSQTSQHAAFYSSPYKPSGMSQLINASMTFGIRDDAPFFHCHGLWRETDGAVRGGHVIPEETVIAVPVSARCWGLHGAAFEARPDSETNFKLFGPVQATVKNEAATLPAYAMRLLPNQDFCEAIEVFCSERRIISASLHGGVGSLIGARFVDGSGTDHFATEMFITSGVVSPDADGKPVAQIDIGLVDYTGNIMSGRLVRGDNPVLMTVELVLVCD